MTNTAKNELPEAILDFLNGLSGNQVVLANGQRNSINSQEDLFAQILANHGFERRTSSEITRKLRKAILNPRATTYPKDDSGPWFVEQPYGTQSFPDFLVCYRGIVIPIELKSNKSIDSTPFWNGHLPTDISIYLVTDGKPEATFFLGSDYLQATSRNALLANRDIIVKASRELDQKELGMKFRVRVAYDADQESPFTHPERKTREANVLYFLRNL